MSLLGSTTARLGSTTARRDVGRWLRCTGGSTAVEFAIVSSLLLVLLLGALQISLLFGMQALLQNAADRAMRVVLIGTPQTQHLTQSQFKAGICLGLPSLISCEKLFVDVQVIAAPSFAPVSASNPVYDGSGRAANDGSYDLGNPGDVVALRLFYAWPMVPLPGMNLANLPGNLRLLVATDVIKTEQYR